MDISWARPLIDAGGWVFAAAVLGTVLWMVIRGDLVPGGVAKALSKRLDALEESQQKDIVPVLKEIGKGVGTTAAGTEVLVDFVRDTIRERERRGP